MTNLTCRELIEFLDDYVAGNQPAEVRRHFEDHMKCCASCHDYLRTYRDTINISRAALNKSDAPVPTSVPNGLVEAILAARKKSS